MLSRLVHPPRLLSGAIAGLALLAATSGCGLGPDRPRPISSVDVARQLTAASKISLTERSPPAGNPGLPELRTTLSGRAHGEWITALVFFETAGATRMVGRGDRVPGLTVLRRHNVVVIYRASVAAHDKSPQLRQALMRLGSTP